MGTPIVLLTGAAGYIGGLLTNRLLEKGCRVLAVDYFRYQNEHVVLPHLSNPRFELHIQNVCNQYELLPLLRRADFVIPLAALVGAPICEKNPVEAKHINTDAVRFLVNNASPNQRIIFPQTNSAYGATPPGVYADEEASLNPLSVYAKTKQAGEEAVLGHPNSVSLRLATVFGASPRMRFDLLVNDFTERVWRERRLVIFEPNFRRNLVGITDVVSAFLWMMDRHWLKGVFNLGNPECNLTKMALAIQVCDALGVPQSCVSIGTGTDQDKRDYLVSNAKVLRTGFQFKHSLIQGIREVKQVVELYSPSRMGGMRNT